VGIEATVFFTAVMAFLASACTHSVLTAFISRRFFGLYGLYLFLIWIVLLFLLFENEISLVQFFTSHTELF
jgi:hypothetical protein